MKTSNKILTKVLFISVVIILSSFIPQNGWNKGGNKAASYYMGTDKDSYRNGHSVNTIKSIDEKVDGFGALGQAISAEKYLGKRVRMSGYIKTEGVDQWAGFWFRVDQKDFPLSLSFDNMHDGKKDNSIKGTNEWKKYEIVLDVPTEATNIVYGVLLSGVGQLWFDEINFEIVEKNIPTTGFLSFVNKLYDQINKEGLEKGIAFYKSIQRNNYPDYRFDETLLNGVGYRLLKDKKINDAIEIFKLNVTEYPKSANVYDSLGEAYLNSGDTTSAIKYYEKALEINPKLPSSIEMLKKIRK